MFAMPFMLLHSVACQTIFIEGVLVIICYGLDVVCENTYVVIMSIIIMKNVMSIMNTIHTYNYTYSWYTMIRPNPARFFFAFEHRCYEPHTIYI